MSELDRIEKDLEAELLFWEDVLNRVRAKPRRTLVNARISLLRRTRQLLKDQISETERARRASFSYQSDVDKWMQACFGEEISANKLERGHRFIEEAIELVQSIDVPKEDVLTLVDYVYNRPLGDPPQEVGGVMVTLAALCNTHKIDLMGSATNELKRVWTKIKQIRTKQATKPGNNSPLPQHVDA